MIVAIRSKGTNKENRKERRRTNKSAVHRPSVNWINPTNRVPESRYTRVTRSEQKNRRQRVNTGERERRRRGKGENRPERADGTRGTRRHGRGEVRERMLGKMELPSDQWLMEFSRPPISFPTLLFFLFSSPAHVCDTYFSLA